MSQTAKRSRRYRLSERKVTAEGSFRGQQLRLITGRRAAAHGGDRYYEVRHLTMLRALKKEWDRIVVQTPSKAIARRVFEHCLDDDFSQALKHAAAERVARRHVSAPPPLKSRGSATGTPGQPPRPIRLPCWMRYQKFPPLQNPRRIKSGRSRSESLVRLVEGVDAHGQVFELRYSLPPLLGARPRRVRWYVVRPPRA